MLKKREPPPKKKSAAVRLELASFGSQVQCAIHWANMICSGNGLLSLVFWENIAVSYLPLKLSPPETIWLRMLIYTQYASFKSQENVKC